MRQFSDGFFRFEEEQRVFNAYGGYGLTDLEKYLLKVLTFMNLSIRYERFICRISKIF